MTDSLDAKLHPWGWEKLSSDFSFTVLANSKIALLLDNGSLTMGFPELIVSSGKSAKMEIL